MKFTRVSGTVEDGTLIKSIDDEIVIDGVTHVIEEVNSYHENWDGIDIYRFDYTLKKGEKTMKELQLL